MPRHGWKHQIVTAIEQDHLDHRAAVAVGRFQARRMESGLEVRGSAVVYTGERVRFEARQTKLDFADATDLPTWVPVDFQMRLDSMQLMLPELAGYALVNAKRDAVAVIPTAPHQIARWKSRRCFVPRLADYDLELSAPAQSIRVLSLNTTPTVVPVADPAPNGG